MTEKVICKSCQKACSEFTPEADFIDEFGICIQCAESLPGVRDEQTEILYA